MNSQRLHGPESNREVVFFVLGFLCKNIRTGGTCAEGG